MFEMSLGGGWERGLEWVLSFEFEVIGERPAEEEE